jgi:hypothetical protein
MDLYRYRFAAWKDWPKVWWTRERFGEYMPPISLNHPFVQRYRKKQE